MKRQQKFITTLSLIVALSGLSPVVAADAGRSSGGEPLPHDQQQPQKYILKQEQMDTVTAGRWANRAIRRLYQATFDHYIDCGGGSQCQPILETLNYLEGNYWQDDAGPVQCYTC